ncbi:hypothetical protein BU15DRAFT_63468 [Melanogaster broomeanus]|nr:hypothetical protein BU15DRAFT_63468 [Melanogaster broomeanus]
MAVKRTGNGGGDPDMDTEELDERLEKARSEGIDLGNLSGATLKKWYSNGWYNLFNSRLGEHPGLIRNKEFRLGTLSDPNLTSGDESGDSDMEIQVMKAKMKPTGSASMKPVRKDKPSLQKGVPVSRHKRQTSQGSTSTGAAEFFSASNEYMKAVTKGDNDRLELLRRCEDREDRRADYLKDKELVENKIVAMNARVKNAMEVLRMDGIPEDIKEEARAMLKNYFATTGHSVFEAYVDDRPNATTRLFAKQAAPLLVPLCHHNQKHQHHFQHSLHHYHERDTFRLVAHVYAEIMQRNESFDEAKRMDDNKYLYLRAPKYSPENILIGAARHGTASTLLHPRQSQATQVQQRLQFPNNPSHAEKLPFGVHHRPMSPRPNQALVRHAQHVCNTQRLCQNLYRAYAQLVGDLPHGNRSGGESKQVDIERAVAAFFQWN